MWDKTQSDIRQLFLWNTIHFADVSPLPNVSLVFCHVSGTRLDCDNAETDGAQTLLLDYRGNRGKHDD